jgi:proteasome accessory factor B
MASEFGSENSSSGRSDRGDKTERLLNLTLALLATKRPLAKNEIFTLIPGYSGSSEAMERMFERDKDELRAIGIDIAVLPMDAYFDDEMGYQIIPRDFFLSEITLTSEESLWLALSKNLVSELSDSEEMRSAFHKLLSYSDSPIEQILEMTTSRTIELPYSDSLQTIWPCIKLSQELMFLYNSASDRRRRSVSPILLTSRIGNWYLVAMDNEDKNVKTFRVDRMSELRVGSNKNFTSPDEFFNLDDFLSTFNGDRLDEVVIRIHRTLPAEHPLLAKSKANNHSRPLEAGSIIELENIDRDWLLERILWAGDSVEVVKPENIRSDVQRILKRVVEVNT